VRFEDFERMVNRLAGEVPPEFLEGVGSIEVSRKTIPHPTRADVYTLGECIPLPAEGDTGIEGIQSRTVLYYGSFEVLAALDDQFDWRGEAWETLTHELRHHLEWRARAPDLEAFDWAAEQNFARQEGEPFDPDFHLSGEAVADGVYRIDDDFFLDLQLPEVPASIPFRWHGKGYTASPPPGTTLPAFLSVEGVEHPPPGELVLALRPRVGLLGLFRRGRPDGPFQAVVTARATEG